MVVQEKVWKPNKASPTVIDCQPHLMTENFAPHANNEIGISDVGFVAKVVLGSNVLIIVISSNVFVVFRTGCLNKILSFSLISFV